MRSQTIWKAIRAETLGGIQKEVAETESDVRYLKKKTALRVRCRSTQLNEEVGQ